MILAMPLDVLLETDFITIPFSGELTHGTLYLVLDTQDMSQHLRQ